MPTQGPTWNSHWPGITSALTPAIFMPAYKHALYFISKHALEFDQFIGVPIVRLNHTSSEGPIGTYTAVIWSLRCGESILGPSKRGLVEGEERVLLLYAEPGFVVFRLLHGGICRVPFVSGKRSSIWFICTIYQKKKKKNNNKGCTWICVAHNKYVLSFTKRITEDCLRPKTGQTKKRKKINSHTSTQLHYCVLAPGLCLNHHSSTQGDQQRSQALLKASIIEN
jgi:hypothetical protein